MIDTWLIFTLVIPFMEVILHTKMAMIRQGINQMEENMKTVWAEKKKKVNQSMKKNTRTLRYIHTRPSI